jgi:RecA/RadA recombinase
MARPKKETQEQLEETSSGEKLHVLDTVLDSNKKFHYAYDVPTDYVVSSGSLTLDIEMGGGIRPGIIRSSGITEGGKTSNALAFARNFQLLHPEKGVVIYIKSEGRLSETIIQRAGIDTNPEKWRIIPTNDYEFVIDMMRTLIRDNDNKNLYFFILDSLDALVPRKDLELSSTQANKVAGGALLTSDLLRKMAAGFSSRGHICFLISQVRSSIKINPYEKSDPKVTNASGGNAALHYSDWILEFQQRWKDDLIYNVPKPEKKDYPVGHYCKIIFRKTPNEKSGREVRYPIKYGRSNGANVWVEYEIVDQLLAWEFAHSKGAWITVSDELIKELSDKGFEMPKQHQGMDNFKTFLEENPKMTKYLFDKFMNVLKR